MNGADIRRAFHGLVAVLAFSAGVAAHAQVCCKKVTDPAAVPASAPAVAQPASSAPAAVHPVKPVATSKPVVKAAAPTPAPLPVAKAKPKAASPESLALVKALTTVYQGAN